MSERDLALLSSLTLLTAFLAQLTGVGIELGGEYLNERIYQSSRPWVALEGAGLQLVLGPRFNVDVRTGGLREKDWDQPGDYGLIVHQLKWGRWLEAGAIAHRTMGNGTLMNRYHNRIDRDHGRLGLTIDMSQMRSHALRPNRYTFMSDQLLGRPVLAAGLGWWSGWGSLDVFYTGDHGAPIKIGSATARDGWLEHQQTHRWALSASTRLNLIDDGGAFALSLLADVNTIEVQGWGIHSGFGMRYRARSDWQIEFDVMAMRSGRDYTWSLFDTSYLVDRWRNVNAELARAEAVWGGQGVLQFTLDDALIIGLGYGDVEQSERADFDAWVQVPLERVTLGAFWKVRRFDELAGLFDMDNVYAALSAGYRLNEWFHVSGVVSRDWFIDDLHSTYKPRTSFYLAVGIEPPRQR